jgi:outer membrane protein assembly factor BamD
VAQARYYVAECLLQQGDRLEAARQFRRIADEFPQHSLAPDALLRAGDAFAELWTEPALDPTYGQTARATYGELLSRFPSSAAAQRVQLRVAELNDRFAEKEYRNGQYYLKFRAYDSAIIYFRDVVATYPQSRFAPLAVLRLIEVYDRIGYVEEKREMCDHLQRYYTDVAGEAEGCG